MIDGLFSIVVSSVIDTIVGRSADGVLNRILDARTIWPRCGASRLRVPLLNLSTNHLHCRQCGLGSDQYANPFHVARLPVRTRGERHAQEIGWSVSPAVFPTDIDVFTVDVRILNLYGDQLDARRDIGRVEFDS